MAAAYFYDRAGLLSLLPGVIIIGMLDEKVEKGAWSILLACFLWRTHRTLAIICILARAIILGRAENVNWASRGEVIEWRGQRGIVEHAYAQSKCRMWYHAFELPHTHIGERARPTDYVEHVSGKVCWKGGGSIKRTRPEVRTQASDGELKCAWFLFHIMLLSLFRISTSNTILLSCANNGVIIKSTRLRNLRGTSKQHETLRCQPNSCKVSP